MHAGRLFSLVLVALLLLVTGCAKRAGTGDPDKGTVDSDTARAVGGRPASDTAAASTPSAEKGKGAVVKLSYFGEQTIEDGAVALMDGGTHGVQGHTVVAAADGTATWERRVEGMRPQGKPGSGRFKLTAGELERIRDSRAELWKLAPAGSRSFDPPIEQGPPRWVWAIVMRQGDETRVLEGGAIAPSEGNTPPEARELLDWLVERVDALAAGR